MTSCSECGGPTVDTHDGYRCLRCGLRFDADEFPIFPMQHPLRQSMTTSSEVSQLHVVPSRRSSFCRARPIHWDR